MTPARPAPGHPPADLPTQFFRALFPDFDLRTVGSLHVAVPRGTLWYAGQSLGEVARQISTAPGPDPESPPRRSRLMITLPAPDDAVRLARILRQHARWSIFWDKRYGVWRAAEDDPDSALYTEARDLDTVLGYITTHS